MNTFTHRLIALQVKSCLEEEFNIFIPQKRLVWGSTKPDFLPTHVSHYKDENINQFHQKWDKLTLLDPINQSEDFAVLLGEVFHYLCDYFCYAHNEFELVNGHWCHFKYEKELHKYAVRQSTEFFKISYADYSQIPYRELIEYKHKLYLQKIPSFENDLITAFELCLITARKLLEDLLGTDTYRVN